MSEDATPENAAPQGLRCDFCGKAVGAVRRVALDGEYERLRTPHRERYACEDCSAAKERARSDPDRG